MTTPKMLLQIREVLLKNLNRDLLDEHMAWIHIADCIRFRATQQANIRHTKAELAKTLLHAQAFLAPLADSPVCRRMARKWTNVDFCPNTPCGQYWWMFACEMVQEVLWIHPEFLAGYRFGRKSKEPYRDSNPYSRNDISRHGSWDLGYILGLTKPTILRKWCKDRKEVENAVR